ncbi:MAG: STAS domain-containing protein [Myxococcales bacterium]|nr:STAS domain-containing protein [Myxococcales bacterium]MCB9671831.1 STAS domain-containing protein [Alphaproteobacteria bacterium]
MATRIQSDAVVLRPRMSRLDAASAAGFRSEALPMVRNKSVCIVDLTAVGFVDSSGLGSLVSLLKAMRPGSQLRLANCAGAVRQLLTLTRLDRIFRTYDSVEAALGG